jgi:hypothetical protein
MKLTKKEAVEILSQADHGFLSKEGVDKIGEAFGVKLSTYLAQANPQDFKGLSLYDKKGNPIDELEGQDADVVAQELCSKIGLTYREFFGRGSQLRECCDKLWQVILELEKEKATSPEVA